MPRLLEAKKDVISCDKPGRGANDQLKPGFPNGATQYVEGVLFRKGRQTRGTETSKYPQEEKINNDSASSGERKRNSPNRLCLGTTGVVGLRCSKKLLKWNALESVTKEGDSPVHESTTKLSSILSRAGHVKSCLNQRGPSRKAKYSQETDSEPVP